jgi:frataxin-like iron-binding protein CyaY
MADQRTARQFIEIWLNSRCSILFHFEVPGGKWHTVTSRPVSAVNLASSVFQARSR